MKIFLDMDGVLCDWIGAACKVMGKDKEASLRDQPCGEYGIEIGMGVDPQEMWKAVDDLGEQFWVDIKPYPWAWQLYRCCQALGETYVLSSPSIRSASSSGKIKWLREFTHEERFTSYVFTKHKHLLAAKDAVLVDDKDNKVSEFITAGGFGVVFPQKWNSNYQKYLDKGDDAWMDVVAELKNIRETIHKEPRSAIC